MNRVQAEFLKDVREMVKECPGYRGCRLRNDEIQIFITQESDKEHYHRDLRENHSVKFIVAGDGPVPNLADEPTTMNDHFENAAHLTAKTGLVLAFWPGMLALKSANHYSSGILGAIAITALTGAFTIPTGLPFLVVGGIALKVTEKRRKEHDIEAKRRLSDL